MSIQIQGNSGTVAEVDSSWRGLRTSVRPLDSGALGHYRIGVQSGALTGTAIVAGAPLFSARWGDGTRFAVITFLRAKYVFTTIITAAQEMGLDAIIARSFSASDTGGTTVTLTGNNQKMRTSMGSSLFTDMRIATTTLLTAGTRSLDAQAFASCSGWDQDGNPATGTQAVRPVQPAFEFIADPAKGEHPIVLATNEGILVRNTILPASASGAWRLAVEMAWAEVTAY